METMARWFSFRFTKNGWLKPHHFFLLFILGIAAFFRLYKIADYMTFLGDEGRDALVVYGILHGKLTFLGPTASVGGFFFGPVYYYFMTPFLWLFNYDPVGPAIMVALFGIATVFLIYKVGSEFFSIKAGLIGAILYSIAPLVVAYSRSSWNPNLMPFFSLLSLYVLYKAVVTNKAALFFITGVLYGIAIQLHYVELFLGATIALYVILTVLLEVTNLRKKISILFRRIVLLLMGFIIGFSPFLLFELRHGFPNTQSILRFILSSGETGSSEKFIPVVSSVFFRLFGRLVANFPPPDQIKAGLYSNIITPWYYTALLLALISTGLLIVYCANPLRRRKDFYKYLLLLLWLFIGILFFGFYKKSIYDYYFQFMYPLPFLLVGMTLSAMYDNTIPFLGRFTKQRLFLKILTIGLFLWLLWVSLTGIPFLSPGNRQKEQVEKIANFVLSKTDDKPYNFALITGGNSDHGYRYFFKLKGRDPITIENTQNDPERKTVTGQLLVVCEQAPCKPLGHPIWEIAGFGRAEISGEWDVSVVKVYKLVHYKEK